MVVTETFIVCDNCGTKYGVDNRHRSGYQHRIIAKKEGWIYKNCKDYCPECKPRKDLETIKQ